MFVAADPPALVRERLAGWARGAAAAITSSEPAPPLRLLDPENLHLTLCFLGSRPVEEITAIGSALSACAVDVGELSVGAPLWLPPARPRSLAVAIHDEAGELAGLHAADQLPAVDALDACLAVRGIGLDGDLPALP